MQSIFANVEDIDHYRTIAAEYVRDSINGKRVVVACPTHDIADRVTEAIRSLLINNSMLVEGKTSMTITTNVLFGEQVPEFAASLCVDRVIEAGTTYDDHTLFEESDEEPDMRIYLSVMLVELSKGSTNA